MYLFTNYKKPTILSCKVALSVLPYYSTNAKFVPCVTCAFYVDAATMVRPRLDTHAACRHTRPGLLEVTTGVLDVPPVCVACVHVDVRPRLRDCPSTRMFPTVSRSGYSVSRVNNGRPGVPLVSRRTYVVCTPHLAELTGNPHRFPRPPHPRPLTGRANGRLPNGSPRPPHPRHVCFYPGTLTDPICIPQLYWEGRCKTRCK